MTAAVQILMAMAATVALVHLILERRRPHPGEFHDIRELTRQTEARAAMRRATRTGDPR